MIYEFKLCSVLLAVLYAFALFKSLFSTLMRLDSLIVSEADSLCYGVDVLLQRINESFFVLCYSLVAANPQSNANSLT